MRLSREASIGVGFVTAVVVLLALVVPSATRSSRALAQAAAPSCAGIQFIGFHGTGEGKPNPPKDPVGMGETVWNTWTSLVKHGNVPDGMSADVASGFPVVNLPSTSDPVQFLLGGWAYASAAVNAADAATAQVQQMAASCPDSKFVFVGYSLGALVAHMTLQKLSEQKFDMAKVAAVVFFGDPLYPLEKPTAPRGGVRPGTRPVVQRNSIRARRPGKAHGQHLPGLSPTTSV